MKTGFIIFVLFSFCSVSFSQNIVGKWTCDKTVMQTLDFGYDDVFCSYKFKKNGTMIVKIEGETKFDNSKYSLDRDHIRRGKIIIKGTYTVSNGKISSEVKKDEIECYADEYNPPIEETSVTTASRFAGQDSHASHYQNSYPVILRAKVRDYCFLWNWNDVPFSVTNRQLKIGDVLICTK